MIEYNLIFKVELTIIPNERKVKFIIHIEYVCFVKWRHYFLKNYLTPYVLYPRFISSHKHLDPSCQLPFSTMTAQFKIEHFGTFIFFCNGGVEADTVNEYIFLFVLFIFLIRGKQKSGAALSNVWLFSHHKILFI